jgi:hypothetical protein
MKLYGLPRCKPLACILLLGVLGCGGAGDEDAPPVPIESIPDDERLADLSDPEIEGVCDWAKELAREALPPAGTRIDCDGLQIQIGAPRCGDVNRCEATLGDYEACLPNVMQRIGEDPCQLLDLVTDEDAQYFVETTPGCEGLDGCAYAL